MFKKRGDRAETEGVGKNDDRGEVEEMKRWRKRRKRRGTEQPSRTMAR